MAERSKSGNDGGARPRRPRARKEAGTSRETASGDAGADTAGPSEDAATSGRASILSDVAACPVAFCPVSMMLTAAGQVRPEVVEHLLAAGREMLLAAQAVVNARAEGFGRSSPIEKIEIG